MTMVKLPLDQLCQFRMNQYVIAKAQRFVDDHPDQYDSVSHFYRVAVFKLIREHEHGMKENTATAKL